MKRLVFSVLMALLMLTGCAPQSGDLSSADSPTDSEPDQTKVTDNALAFKAQYIRTDGLFIETTYPAAIMIDSATALTQYYQENQYDYSQLADILIQSADLFWDTMPVYDDAFFAAHCLAIVLLEEPSGSIRHDVTKAVHIENTVTISIDRIRPGMGTTDMAQWHIFVELPKEAAGSEVAIDITQIGEDIV